MSCEERTFVVGLPTTDLFSLETSDVVVVAPPDFVVDRLEVYGFSQFLDVEVFAVDGEGSMVSLLDGEHTVPAESFKPGNTIFFNRERLTGASLVVRVTNCNHGAVIFRGALFGEAREPGEIA